jgi:hypothetical protein
VTLTWSNEPMAEEPRSPFAPVGLADGEDPPALGLGHELVPPPPPIPPPVPPPPAPYDDMAEIITHWSLATGWGMKARKVTISPRGPAPAPGVPTPATNGYRAAVPARS